MDYSQTFQSFGEALGYALPTSALGFLTVFGVLALLWGILEIFKIVFYTIPTKKKNAAKIIDTPKTVTDEPETAENTSEEEIVAAIMGAISAYRAENGESAGGFRVVSFKKRA